MSRSGKMLRDYLASAGKRRSLVREKAATGVWSHLENARRPLPLAHVVEQVQLRTAVSDTTVRRVIKQMARAGLLEVIHGQSTVRRKR